MKKIFTLFLFITSFLLLQANHAYAQINTQDSLALVDLYNSTGGPNWIDHTNWLTTAPVSSWYGITLNGSRISSLSLSSNNLNGSIPSSLGNLLELNNFYLQHNKLSGTLPQSLGKLFNLINLRVEDNQLSGLIPLSLGALIRLKSLYLDYNQFSGRIPFSLSILHNLQYLDLSYNQLTGNILFLNFLTNLKFLSLGNNHLYGNIPNSISRLNNLTLLSLNNNNLTGGIPSEIGKLSKLDYLDLSYNQLTGSIPSELGNLSNIESYFLLNNNQLSGEIPSSLTKLAKTVYIHLENNKFTFAGLLNLLNAFPYAVYAPQAVINLTNNNGVLSVSAGSNKNTYHWFNIDASHKLVATIQNDSIYNPGVSGHYYVRVSNSEAPKLTLYSDTVYYNASDNSIALKINNKISSISVYPNPATSFTTLSFNTDGKYSITITDVSGKILQTKTGVTFKGINTIQLDVSKYASGMYLIIITDEKNRKQTLRLNKE
jgi:Leucine-rich repeat (LRR) protein